MSDNCWGKEIITQRIKSELGMLTARLVSLRFLPLVKSKKSDSEVFWPFARLIFLVRFGHTHPDKGQGLYKLLLNGTYKSVTSKG